MKMPKATLSMHGLYLNSVVMDKIRNWKYALIYYACTNDGLIVTLKKTNYSKLGYKINYIGNCGLITCTQLANLLVYKPKISTTDIEFKEDAVIIKFRR